MFLIHDPSPSTFGPVWRCWAPQRPAVIWPACRTTRCCVSSRCRRQPAGSPTWGGRRATWAVRSTARHRRGVPTDDHAGRLPQALERDFGGVEARPQSGLHSWAPRAVPGRPGGGICVRCGAGRQCVRGISPANVLIFGVAASVVAAVGAVAGGFADHRLGSKPVIVGSLVAIIAMALAMMALSGPIAFWVCGLALCLFIGPFAVLGARPAAADGHATAGKGWRSASTR